MVAISQIDIQKQLGNEFWSNRYLSDLAVGSAELEALAVSIYTAEKALHPPAVVINKVRLATLTPGDDIFQTWNPNIVGTRTIGTATLLPLFCVARFDFGAGLGRPSRKYIRASLTEADINGDNLESTYMTGVGAAYGTAIAGANGIVDPDGTPLDGYSVSSRVGMRQLRRGSRRRTEPVL